MPYCCCLNPTSDLETPKPYHFRISQGHSLYQLWTPWDHSCLSCAPDKQTNKETDGPKKSEHSAFAACENLGFISDIVVVIIIIIIIISYPRRPILSAWVTTPCIHRHVSFAAVEDEMCHRDGDNSSTLWRSSSSAMATQQFSLRPCCVC